MIETLRAYGYLLMELYIEDFRKDIHYISRKELQNKNIVRYFAGVDWGYEHYGAVVLIGEDDKGNLYLIKEIAKQYQDIDYWVKVAKDIISKYGNIPFYCDTARPEHIVRFQNEGINALCK